MLDDLSPTQLSANEVEYRFRVDGLPDDTFAVAELHAREALSEPFELKLHLLGADVSLSLGKVIGKTALLTSESAMGKRYFHGLVREVQIAEKGRTWIRYKVVVVPQLWLLSRRRNSRIFQAMTTLDILVAVFEGAGIAGDALELRLNRSYAARDYCVQYRETDLDFAQRLMEEEGICYFFLHSEHGHVLVLADDVLAHEDIETPKIRFSPPSAAGGAGQFVEQLLLARTIQPGKATLRDFNFKRPSESLEVTVEYDGAGASVDGEVGDTNTDLEYYEFPGEYVDKGLGETLARLRLERLQVDRFRVDGESTVRRLSPGACASLAGHPRPSLNARYLITRVEHHGTQPVPDLPDDDAREHTYRNRFDAIPAELPYRPALRTPRPIIAGIQTAVVTGPAGEEIHTDEFGRVKVQFHWDRQGRQDDQSSCWVRVSHPSAGAGYGQIIIPRVGQEVIVQFLEGDPDRPVVTGRLYNGEQTPPSPLPGGKARSSIKSNSYPGGGGYNELTFDDTAGAEQLVMHGQKDASVTVGNNSTTSVGVDESHSVGANRSMSVGGNETASVTGNRTASVDGNEDQSVKGNQSTSITGNQTNSVTGNRTSTVTGNDTLTVSGTSTTTVTGGDTTITVAAGSLKGTASADVDLHADVNAKVDGGATVKVTSPDITIEGASTVTVTAGSTLTLQVGGSTIELTSGEIKIMSPKVSVGHTDIILSGATVDITGSGSVAISGASISSSADGDNSVSGAVVKLN